MSESCEICKFFKLGNDPIYKERGICRKNPPQRCYDSQRDDYDSYFPNAWKTSWCGRWKRKPSAMTFAVGMRKL